ncbi:hypothetical protein [Microbulbifer taiwanensis]|uniref:hypothetical protein n=1 Tax=Microbulbifer taiwanensis TaxID=986746 RepID=UPI00361A1C36
MKEYVDSEDVDDDDLYEAEEELNDYVTLLGRLKDKYNSLQDKGELPKDLVNKINALV